MEFNGVEETLFIPLAARIFVSLKFPNYFFDTKSLEVENLDQIKNINKDTKEYFTYYKNTLKMCF
jgi:conjugative transposon O-methyltransferase